MPTRRFYANTPPQRTLSTSLTSSGTTATVSGTFAGWPASFPFFAVLEIGTANAEIVSVTGVSGSVATIVRGQDGTVAVAHSGGATFDQVVIAKDLDEANAHTSANTGVHGISGHVVGDTDAQTLTNKTLTAPTISSPTVTGTLAGASETLSGTLGVTGNATVGGTLGVTGAVTTTNGVTVGGALVVSGTINGQSIADTDWQTLPLNSGYETNTVLPQYRVLNGQTFLRGNVKPSSGSFTGGTAVYIVAGGIPAGARIGTSGGEWVASNAATGVTSRALVYSNGNLQVVPSATTASIELAGIGPYIAEN